MAELQFSLWNFVRYNVFGGGDSALYGVEGPSFYLRNGLNNLNVILPLGLIYPLVALLDLFQVTGELPYLLLWEPPWLLHLLPCCVVHGLLHVVLLRVVLLSESTLSG